MARRTPLVVALAAAVLSACAAHGGQAPPDGAARTGAYVGFDGR
jgi:hypothetical protein